MTEQAKSPPEENPSKKPADLEMAVEKSDPESRPSSGLTRRIVSAILMSAFGLIVTILGGWVFAFASGLVGVLIVLEWQTLTGVQRNSATGLLQSTTIIIAIGLSVLGPIDASLVVLGLGALAAGAAARVGGTKLSDGIFGVFYIGLPMIAAMWLRETTYGMYWVFWTFAVVWAGDTGAYAFGRTIGGPKLAPKISPNKTWAGSIGGAIVSVLAGSSALFWMPDFGTEHLGSMAAFAFVIAIVAQLGDLGESWFKRKAGVKDSGNLIPGHGGALDRMDGFLTAVLVVAGVVYFATGFHFLNLAAMP